MDEPSWSPAKWLGRLTREAVETLVACPAEALAGLGARPMLRLSPHVDLSDDDLSDDDLERLCQALSAG